LGVDWQQRSCLTLAIKYSAQGCRFGIVAMDRELARLQVFRLLKFQWLDSHQVFGLLVFVKPGLFK